MNSNKSRLFVYFLSVGLMMVSLVFPVLAEYDPEIDPNSPEPILLSEDGTTRALAVESFSGKRTSLEKIESRAFAPESSVVVFVTNLDLMKDEGADAFRAYIETKEGRQYRFPVLNIQPVPGREWVYAITILLKDDVGFWEPPTADGDVLLRISWRGMTSNRVRLGYGAIGGNVKDDAGAVPTPLKQFSKPPVKEQVDNYVGYRWSGDRMRLLEQATFGPNPALDARIRRIGLKVWLNEQLNAPYPSANYPYPNFLLMSTTAPNTCNGSENPNTVPPDPPDSYPLCFRDHYSMYAVQNWFFKEAFYGDSQLRHRVAWALNQMWVTSGFDIQQSSHMLAYHKVLSNNAFGNFRTLMKEMTLNPAMGEYLDMRRSTKNSPNENYPREILQLFTIGLYMLNQNGTVQTDANNNPIPSYDQTTVNNFTKVFTGWSLCETTAVCPNRSLDGPNYIDPMLLNQTNHDVTAKTLLSYPNAVNTNIPANTNGNTELDLALDNIFNHPNVAPFVSKYMIQHLVTSDPTPAYVGRVAAVFNNNGSGVRGDMKAVIKAILLDPEARGNVKTDPNFGKLREPVLLLTNLFRAFNVRSADGTQQSDGVVAQLTNNMLQNPFYPPTVFNFYAPGFVIPGTTINGPEFGIMTTGTSITRANFVNTMVFSRVNVSVPTIPNGTSLDFSELQALSTADPTGNQLMDALNQKMMHNAMPSAMRETIRTAVLAVPATTPLVRAQQAVYLVATASQYQVQR